MYTTKQVGAIFGRSHETIRLWAEEFQPYLEPLATPGKGRNRSFTEADLEVLALIAKMKEEGFNFEDIHQSLKHGQRGTPPGIAPEEAQSLVRTESERRLFIQLQELQSQLRLAYDERDRALQAAESARTFELQVARMESELAYLRTELEKEKSHSQAQTENEKLLHQQLGELRGELKMLRRQAGLE
jgi:DNA-binding transcriptional MerR regulator